MLYSHQLLARRLGETQRHQATSSRSPARRFRTSIAAQVLRANHSPQLRPGRAGTHLGGCEARHRPRPSRVSWPGSRAHGPGRTPGRPSILPGPPPRGARRWQPPRPEGSFGTPARGCTSFPSSPRFGFRRGLGLPCPRQSQRPPGRLSALGHSHPALLPTRASRLRGAPSSLSGAPRPLGVLRPLGPRDGSRASSVRADRGTEHLSRVAELPTPVLVPRSLARGRTQRN